MRYFDVLSRAEISNIAMSILTKTLTLLESERESSRLMVGEPRAH